MADEFVLAIQDLKKVAASNELRMERKIDGLRDEVHALALRISEEIRHSETIETMVGAMTSSLRDLGAHGAKIEALEIRVSTKADNSKMLVVYWAIGLQWPLLLAILWFLIKAP